MRNVIGVVGYAGSGKDEFARGVVELDGWKRVAFADSLKTIARAVGWDGEKDDHGRRLLQDLGMAVRTTIHKDAWVQALETEVDRPENLGFHYVVPDVRFDNEVEWVRSRGGVIVVVDRRGIGPVNDHVSETLPDRVEADLRVGNNGSLETLHAEARTYALGLSERLRVSA